MEAEPPSHQILGVIYSHAVEIVEDAAIDRHLNAIALTDEVIGVALFVKRHRIVPPSTTPRFNPETKPDIWVGLFGLDAFNFGNGCFTQLNHEWVDIGCRDRRSPSYRDRDP